MTSPASTTQPAGRFAEVRGWAFFCFLIFTLKLLLFAIDPLPKLYLGDSDSYIWTAVSGWIPEDRSYFYGYVIRWTSFWCESLTGLLVLQIFLSTITCLLFAAICRFIFKLPARSVYLFSFLCALDPLQLLYERYVMAEAVSLCLYAFVTYYSFLYFRDRRLRDLTLVQVFSVLLIGFRMSFLPLVQINTILLPLIAFAPDVLEQIRRRQSEHARWRATIQVCFVHLLISGLLMFVLHTGYKRANGWVSDRAPAYLYGTGLVLLSYWSPVLQPKDAVDPRLADLINKGDEFGLKNPDLRNSQRFAPGYLIDRWSKIEPDPSKADRFARRTARRALLRDPLGVLGLGLRTYTNYWKVETMKRSAEMDFSFGNPPSGNLVALLASRFHLAYATTGLTKSAVQWYYVAAWPYYFLILLAPLLSGLAIVFRFGRLYAILLFVHISIMMATSMTFGSDSVRYLQPISFLTLLVFALGTKATLRPVGQVKNQTLPDHERIAAQSGAIQRLDLDCLAQSSLIPS